MNHKEEQSPPWLADAAEALGEVRPSDGAPLALNWTQVIEAIRDMREERDEWKLRAEQSEHGCGGCVALQAQLDAVSDEIGGPRMEEVDGYHCDAVKELKGELAHLRQQLRLRYDDDNAHRAYKKLPYEARATVERRLSELESSAARAARFCLRSRDGDPFRWRQCDRRERRAALEELDILVTLSRRNNKAAAEFAIAWLGAWP